MIDFNKYINITEPVVLQSEEALAFNALKKLNTFRAYNRYDNNVCFSHNGVRNSPNEWLILDKVKGKGGFGSVSQCKIKVVIEKGKVTLHPVNVVVKTQQLKGSTKTEKEAQIKEIRSETLKQLNHRVNVTGYLIDQDTAYIIMADCGPSLDKILPNCNYTFNERIAIANGIATEMLLLKQTNTIHRDLKPANICLKRINDQFEVRFIDFGLAVDNDVLSYNNSGTLLYMSPDVQVSYKSDIYALSAIFAEVLGCPARYLFKNKYANRYNCENERYDFNHLFDGVSIPQDIDGSLLQDFKRLLNAMQNQHPEYRPPIETVFKFLLLIPYRQAYTRTLLEKKPQIEQLKKELNQTNSTLFTVMKREFAQIETNIQRPRSHYDEAISMARANKLNSEYNDPYKLHKFDSINEKIQQLTKELTTFIGKEAHFNGSNSSGIPELFTILKSNDLSTIEKLDKLKSLGERKTEDSVSNWYSRSHFFGNGRHKNIELLYKRCAELSLDAPNDTLDAINHWESRMNTFEGFTHNRPLI